jgi:TrpR-related protein YerC/YecD
MSNQSDWRTNDVDALCGALLAMQSPDEMARFLRDVCTVGELEALGHRWAAARMLAVGGRTYAEVAREVGTSTTTVTRVAHWLRHGEGGYTLALERAGR